MKSGDRAFRSVPGNSRSISLGDCPEEKLEAAVLNDCMVLPSSNIVWMVLVAEPGCS